MSSSSKLPRPVWLLGWVSLTLDGRLRLSSIAVRRTLDGRMALSFPTRAEGVGQQSFYFRPLDDRTRREIEEQVFEALGFAERRGPVRRGDEGKGHVIPKGVK